MTWLLIIQLITADGVSVEMQLPASSMEKCEQLYVVFARKLGENGHTAGAHECRPAEPGEVAAV
jgi:hypothetical protein